MYKTLVAIFLVLGAAGPFLAYKGRAEPIQIYTIRP